MEAAVRWQESTSGEIFHCEGGEVLEAGIPRAAGDRSGVCLERIQHHRQVAETDRGHTGPRQKGEEECGGPKRYHVAEIHIQGMR